MYPFQSILTSLASSNRSTSVASTIKITAKSVKHASMKFFFLDSNFALTPLFVQNDFKYT